MTGDFAPIFAFGSVMEFLLPVPVRPAELGTIPLPLYAVTFVTVPLDSPEEDQAGDADHNHDEDQADQR